MKAGLLMMPIETIIWCFASGIAMKNDVISLKINPFLTNGLVHPYHLDECISSFRGVWWIFSVLLYFQ